MTSECVHAPGGWVGGYSWILAGCLCFRLLFNPALVPVLVQAGVDLMPLLLLQRSTGRLLLLWLVVGVAWLRGGEVCSGGFSQAAQRSRIT